MNRFAIAALALATTASAGAEDLYGFTQGERLEYRFESEVLLWDLQGRYGGDYHRFWWKTEGDLDDGTAEEAELQLLYSRAWTAFFDLQAGVRLLDTDGTRVNAIALGVQGLAQYRFETDAVLFIAENGDITSRLEFEREFVFGRKTVVQPRLEVNLALQDIPVLRLARGVTDVALGLRIRYEFTRKFAPYFGVSYVTATGATADLIDDDDASETTLVAGVRFWF